MGIFVQSILIQSLLLYIICSKKDLDPVATHFSFEMLIIFRHLLWAFFCIGMILPAKVVCTDGHKPLEEVSVSDDIEKMHRDFALSCQQGHEESHEHESCGDESCNHQHRCCSHCHSHLTTTWATLGIQDLSFHIPAMTAEMVFDDLFFIDDEPVSLLDRPPCWS